MTNGALAGDEGNSIFPYECEEFRYLLDWNLTCDIKMEIAS